jgi:cysteine desulfurase/selenocysteine lyase
LYPDVWGREIDIKKEILKDFPILGRKIGGKRLIYLDSTATSQKPIQVLDVIYEFYSRSNSNVHRGIYKLSEESTEAYEKSREKIKKFIGARDKREIIFTRNATESLNLIAYSWGSQIIRKGDNILLTVMEHHSNLLPWRRIAREKKANIHYIGITKDGRLDLSELDNYSKLEPKILAITHVSNVLGTINPIKDLAKWIHDLGGFIVVDGAQSVPHMPVDVNDLDADFLVFSGHKMLGPTGIGVLYGKFEILDEMEPFLVGGEMISRVTLKDESWNELPWKFEAGTPNYVGAIALGMAIDYLNALGMDWVYNHERRLVRYALDKLLDVPGIKIYGPLDDRDRGGIISFTMDNVHPHDIATLLDEDGICIRSGHHCAQPLHDILGVPATARASFYIYNWEEDIDALTASLMKIHKLFAI